VKHVRRIIRMAHLFGGWDILRVASELALRYEKGLGKSRPSPFSQYLTGRGNAKPVSRRSLSSARVGLALTLALGLGACADSPTGTIAPPAGVSKSLIATPSDAQAVARGLASAMRDPSIRAQVHAAMRGSSFNEHKLVLQDFANTPPGEHVLTAVGAALGQSLGSVKSEVASLPALDFYLPFPTHRQSWKPTEDVYVATTFDKRAPLITAYGSNGQVLELRQADGVPAVPLIILHPAEPKTAHTTPLANSDGGLIESPTRMSTPQGSFLIYCGDACGGGGGGGGTVVTQPPPGTYINHFNIKADDGWFGNSEMRFRSYAISAWQFQPGPNGTSWYLFGNLCDKGVYSQDGVVTSVGYDGLYLISPTVTRGSIQTCNGLVAQYAIHITEVDGDLNGNDDDYGWRIYAAGNYPSGTMYDPVVNSFYAETFPNGLFGPLDDAHRTAYLRVIVY